MHSRLIKPALLSLILLCNFLITTAQYKAHTNRISFVAYGFGNCLTNTAEGEHTNAPTGFEITKRTSRIKTVMGAHFGMEFMFLGPQGRTFNYTKVWTFPEAILDPETGQKSKTLSIGSVAYANTKSHASYILEYPYELMKGKWSLAFYYKGKLVRKEDFVLY